MPRRSFETPVTFALLAVFAGVYALELAYGVPDRIHVRVQLVAGSRAALEQGELWRLVTATFLHANLVHTLMNSYSLYRLGQGTERVLGPTRFALLYMLSGLGRALLSAAVSEWLSVGASGAVWGLTGAQGARGKARFGWCATTQVSSILANTPTERRRAARGCPSYSMASTAVIQAPSARKPRSFTWR